MLVRATTHARRRQYRGAKLEKRRYYRIEFTAEIELNGDVLMSGVTMNTQNQEIAGIKKAPDGARPGRILIDCTETLTSGLTTGIQRVVRKIAERTEQLSRATGIPCIAVVTDGVKVSRVLPFVQAPSSVRIRRIQGRAIVDKGRLIWDRWVEPAFGGLGLRAVARRAAWILFIGRPILFRKNARHLNINVKKGDLLLLPDSFWGLRYSIRLAEKARAVGACVVPIIHDIFPITHPEFADTKNGTAFEAAFARLIAACHGLLTVSRFTQSEVETLLTRQGIKVPPIRSFYLGADVVSKDLNTTHVRADIQKLRDVYLMVGTIEPRKDHATVLDAFERLWRNGACAALVLVGRAGWRCKKLQRRLDDHPLRNKLLFVLYDATDSDLDYLYRHARALVIASKVEGFGLPLVEAMRYGVPVIASRIDVFCEIGGAYPEYFSAGSDQELSRIIAQYERQGTVRRTPQRWLNWDDAALTATRLAIDLYETCFVREQRDGCWYFERS